MHGNTAKQIVRITICCLTALFIIMINRGFAAYNGVTCGDDADTYCIDTLEKLQGISPGNLDKACYLTDNIDASETATWNGGAGFAPIDNFTGTFEGNGHAISGLTVSGSGAPAGLFGIVMPEANPVIIQNVTLENVVVTGDSDVGALVGSVDMVAASGLITMSIENCAIVSGTVSGTGPATGGLVGSVQSFIQESSVMISGCTNGSTVTGVSHVGGLVGRVEGDLETPVTCSLVRNANTGSVAGTGNNVGGLAGYMENGVILDCSNQASVNGMGYVGGLVGNILGAVFVQKSYNLGAVSASGDYAGGFSASIQAISVPIIDPDTGLVTGYDLYAPQIMNNYNRGSVSGHDNVGGFAATNINGIINNAYAACTVTGTTANVGGFLASNTGEGNLVNTYWDGSLSGILTGSVADVMEVMSTTDMKTIATFAAWDFNTVWAMEQTVGHETYPFFCFKGGTGVSTEDPIRIGDVYGLQAMGEESLASAYFMLVSDVDAGITQYWNDGQGFTPVGCEDIPFEGTVYGQGFAIHDLFIKRLSQDSVGLFALLGSSAIIDRLSIENASVVGGLGGILAGASGGTVTNCSVSGSMKGYVRTGGLVGYVSDGHLENCSSSADVLGFEMSGGLIGNMMGGTVVNCKSRGTVYADEHAGGFVGRVMGGRISGCMAKGEVYGQNYVGGFVGVTEGLAVPEFEQCASSCYVSGDKYVGGFAGLTLGSHQSCLSSGAVTGMYQTGGFVGGLYGSVADCMSSGEVNGQRQSGGFAGYLSFEGSITRGYSKGVVTGTELTGGYAGLNGAGEDGIQLSFWDMDTSGMTDSQGGQGLTSTAMMQSQSFGSWDFVSVWDIIEGITRPYLQLPMATTDLELTYSGLLSGIQDGESFDVQLTVANTGGKQADHVTIQPSFNVSLDAVRYSLDGGATWQDTEGRIEIGESLAIGQSRSIHVQGVIHVDDQDEAEGEFSVDFDGIDWDLSNNSPGVTWGVGPGRQGSSDDQVVYGGDGGGCFIQSVEGI